MNAWFPTRGGHGYELDLWWPAIPFDLEIDGPRHRMPHQRRRDAIRDADLRSFGVRVARVPAITVSERSDELLTIVRRALTLEPR